LIPHPDPSPCKGEGKIDFEIWAFSARIKINGKGLFKLASRFGA
jgi:hypothetical protein